MKTIKSTTKRGQSFINAYNHSSISELWQAYGRYSTDKAVAQNQCKTWYISENGSDYRIISYNTFSFSVAWKVAEGLRVETSSNSYLIVNA